MKKIPLEYFNQLVNSGHTVPRDKKTGDFIPFKVGKEYVIGNDENRELLKVRCTQDCPYHLIVVKIN